MLTKLGGPVWLFKERVFQFDPIAFESQHYFWNLKWQSAWFAIVNWRRQCQSQSNSQNACNRATYLTCQCPEWHRRYMHCLKNCTIYDVWAAFWSSFPTHFHLTKYLKSPYKELEKDWPISLQTLKVATGLSNFLKFLHLLTFRLGIMASRYTIHITPSTSHANLSTVSEVLGILLATRI